MLKKLLAVTVGLGLAVGLVALLVARPAQASTTINLVGTGNTVIATVDIGDDDVLLGCNSSLILQPGNSGKICNDTGSDKTIWICPEPISCCCTSGGTLRPGGKHKIHLHQNSSTAVSVVLN